MEDRTGIKDIYLQDFKVFAKVDQRRKLFLDALIASNFPEKEEVFKIALQTHKSDRDQKFNAFNLLLEKFAMKEVQQIYETIFEHKFTRRNFQKKILDMDVLERLEKKIYGSEKQSTLSI